MKFIPNPLVLSRIETFPESVCARMLSIRSCIETIAKSIDENYECVETFKWNQPSYTSKISSTIRMDWAEKHPEYYGLYFTCSSRIIETARGIFEQDFTFIGNREIRFAIDDDPFETPFLRCILRAALKYHLLKHDPMLGMDQ